jgi:DNA-binding IclR family transcriptional regulator
VREAGIIASLSLVADDSRLDESQRRRLVLLVVSAASLVAEELRYVLTPPTIVEQRHKMVKQ